ncbi:MAG: heparan-alpha-glucosaminide N-acetyltransferase domain-containing protein [Planctomycetota bacterium]
MRTASRGRQRSIDFLRGVAIALMVLVHFAENLSGWYGGAGGPFVGVHRTWWLPTGFAAPIFTFLSGLSYRLWADLQRERGRSDDWIAKSSVRRGLFLIGLGFAFNVLIWLPEDVFNWDILTLIGGGLLVLAAARWVPDPAIAFSAAVVVAVAPALRVAADYMAFWTGGFFDYEFTLADVTLGWLVTGYFPVFPWLAFPLAGYALGPSMLAGSRTAFLAAGGLVAAALGLMVSWPVLPPVVTGDAVRVWSMFPPSTAYVLGTLGTVMLALAMAHRLLDEHADRGRLLMDWLAPLSRHALSIYLLHHAVHVWPLWAAGLASEGKVSSLWQVAMPVGWAVALAGGFLVAAAVLFRWVDRQGLPSPESLMRWLCD